MNVLIKSATIVDSSSALNGKRVDILIEKGIITQIKTNIKPEKNFKLIESSDLCLSPGWLDMQARFCDPGLEQKEDLESGLAAAAAGGFTAVCAMPSTDPPLHGKTQIDYVINKTKHHAVDVFPIGCLTVDRAGKEMAELYDMKKAGAIAFSDDKRPVKESGLLLRLQQYSKNINAFIISHCEDTSISADGQMHEGETSTRIGLKGIPSLAEEIMLQRNISITSFSESQLHVPCISTKQSVELVRKAKQDHIQISAGVAAHQLLLDDSKLSEFDTNYKVNPPLRPKEDIEALKKGLANNTIDVIVSDHSPEDIESKDLEFDLARHGMIGLETAFAVANTACQSKLKLDHLIEKICHNPRKLLGIEIPILKEGEQANFTLFDPSAEWIVAKEDILSRSKNTPFIGQKLKGKVLGIINKNQLVLNKK
jgi:dihydroorotase